MFCSILLASAIISIAFGQDCSSPPPQINPEQCCPGLPKYISKEIVDECKATGAPKCEVSTCLLNKKNLLNNDGSLDTAAIRALAINGISGELASAVETSLQTCFDDADDDHCPAMSFTKCFMRTLLKNCPESIWSTSAECTAAKQYFLNCKPRGRQ